MNSKPWLERAGKLLCPFCKAQGVESVMQFHHAYLVKATLDPRRTVGIYERDECWKCPRCRFVPKFGFPLTKRQYEETKEAWGGTVNWVSEDKDIIRRRFEELGYLDVER